MTGVLCEVLCLAWYLWLTEFSVMVRDARASRRLGGFL